MNIFRFAALLPALAVCFALISCATPEERLARRELRTQLNHGAKVATCNAVKLSALPGKTYFLVFPDKMEYNGLCDRALRMSLSHFGFTSATSAEQADFVLECSYSTESTIRMRTTVRLSAKKGTSVYWNGTFFCRSRQRDCAQYLEGLCVAGSSWLGKSFSGDLNVIKYHRKLLETVYTQK